MAVYERGSGAHIAERVQPVPGSEEAERYAALADDPASGWRCVEPDPEPEPEPTVLERPAKSASKADWKAYAVQEGMDEAEADAATRDELAAKYADGGDD
ncbi:hypothetical protein [Streptomyces sp. NPDC057623]|uniref:hypothetical protein n=1 Tax=Streptomyces sp. NPDC057623 TaxID=3346187 RepID=UPI0036D1A7E9